MNKSTLYSDVMAPNIMARPPRGKYGADEEKIILFPVATTSHREAATTNNGYHHHQDHHLHHNHLHHHHQRQPHHHHVHPKNELEWAKLSFQRFHNGNWT